MFIDTLNQTYVYYLFEQALLPLSATILIEDQYQNAIMMQLYLFFQHNLYEIQKHSQMDLKTNHQSKQYFKSKVNDLMQEYDKQKQEEQRQKQQMKKQIMLDIMAKRQKSQNASSKEKSDTSNRQHTFKTDFSDVPPSDVLSSHSNSYTRPPKPLKNEVALPSNKEPQSDPPSRVQQFKEQSKKFDKFEQMTFNMKKRNKSLQDELNYRRIQNIAKEQSVEGEEINQDETQQPVKNKSRLNEYVQKSSYKSSQVQQNQQEDQQEEPVSKYSKYSKYFQKPTLQNQNKSYYNQKSQALQPNHDEENQVQEIIQEDDQRGVFLTMEESESMTASDLPKNYTFQIKMDKSIDPENLQELKKQKIKEMEKKRQERIEQFRRNQSQKKVQMPKGRNSYSKKHDKTEKDEINQSDLPPRSGTIEKKNQKVSRVQNKQPSKNHPIPLQSHQSHYNIRPTSKQGPNYSNNYDESKLPISKQINNYPNSYEDRQIKTVSPFRTPKSILSENRGKSNNKNTNIFVGDNNRQKSGNKITQPRIQPKDRKNSFTKQSNKKLMINAITYVCFPGQLNRRQRQRLIQVLESSQYQFFIFLFKQYSRKIIKGIYVLDSSQSRCERIYGEKAPFQITAQKVQQFYRFDSGSREFKKVDGCRSFSLAIHAVDLR